MRVLLFLLIIIWAPGVPVSGQERPGYLEADRFARAYTLPVKTRGALDSLVRAIDLRFADPWAKTRAMFTWVAAHLEYECSQDGLPALGSVSLDQVLRTGRSQCAGYANLLQYGLRAMGLETITIRGVARTAKKDLWWEEDKVKPNHAWNAVKIDGQWRLLDATWASGASDADCQVITREFAPFYFDPPPILFALSHLPSDSQWQLLERPVSREAFLAGPLYHDPFYETGVKNVKPSGGVLRIKANETITFRFTSSTPLDKIAVWCEERKDIKPEFGKMARKGDEYFYTYRLQVKGDHFLNVSLDGHRTALVYYIIVGM